MRWEPGRGCGFLWATTSASPPPPPCGFCWAGSTSLARPSKLASRSLKTSVAPPRRFIPRRGGLPMPPAGSSSSGRATSPERRSRRAWNGTSSARRRALGSSIVSSRRRLTTSGSRPRSCLPPSSSATRPGPRKQQRCAVCGTVRPRHPRPLPPRLPSLSPRALGRWKPWLRWPPFGPRAIQRLLSPWRRGSGKPGWRRLMRWPMARPLAGRRGCS